MTLKKEFKSSNKRQRLTTVRKSNSKRQLQQAQEKQIPNFKIIRIIVYER